MFALPIHPAFVHFPLAMLTAAWVAIVGWYWTRRDRWDDVARLFEAIGVLTIPIVIVTGFVDANGFEVLTEPRWDAPLIWHLLTAVAASLVFAGHWLWRRGRDRRGLVGGAVALDLAWASTGLWLFVLAGLIAGEMVYNV